ncbi:hypothetical protein D3C81_1589890 [compost metagenome]
MHSASHSARAMRNKPGVWAKRPMNTTDMTVPTKVPASRARPFCTTIPDSGWATMKAVISAQDGCSRPQRIASHSARPPPSRVLMANLRARLLGANRAWRVMGTRRTLRGWSCRKIDNGGKDKAETIN